MVVRNVQMHLYRGTKPNDSITRWRHIYLWLKGKAWNFPFISWNTLYNVGIKWLGLKLKCLIFSLHIFPLLQSPEWNNAIKIKPSRNKASELLKVLRWISKDRERILTKSFSLVMETEVLKWKIVNVYLFLTYKILIKLVEHLIHWLSGGEMIHLALVPVT